MSKLTPRQEAFCQEYALSGNATQSALAAGYSTISAHNQGPRLIKKDSVAARIKEIRNAQAEKREGLWRKAETVLETVLDDYIVGDDDFKKSLASPAIRAADIAAKIHGKYAPSEVRVSATLTDLQAQAEGEPPEGWGDGSGEA